MKKLTMTVAMFITVMSAAIGSGNGSKSVRANVIPAKDQVYKIIYTAKETNIVKVRVRNEEGQVIRTDRVKNDGGFILPYNMSSLEDGKYVVEITDKLGTISESVEINNENTMENQSSMAVKALDDKRYRLTVSSLNITDVELTIFDGSGELVHQENHNNLKGFSRIYDLSKCDSNNFVFELNGVGTSQILAVE
ncbi:MAG: hypothetical protein RIA69_17270 [Cyclobacteriaceae bacterium]